MNEKNPFVLTEKLVKTTEELQQGNMQLIESLEKIFNIIERQSKKAIAILKNVS